MIHKNRYVLGGLFAVFVLSCCSSKIETGDISIIHETKFNSCYINIQNEGMQEKGFAFGDSCNVYYSNGESLMDIPYFDGYYTRSDFPLICGYQGYPYVQITKNNTSDFWDAYKLDETYTVNVVLNEKGKYKNEQEAFSMHYSNDRGDFSSNEEFANFREIKTSNILSNKLYRGASPFNDAYNRAHYVDDLLKENKVKFILDLSDSEADIEEYKKKYDLSSSYALEQKAVFLNMGSNFRLDGAEDAPEPNLFSSFVESPFKTSLGKGLKEMIKYDGPYYVHCVEGKDRTGFVCMLLEALCGASYQEMKKDYMITYYNYFKIKEDDPKYEAVSELRFDEFMEYLSSSKDIENISYVDFAKDYLKACGLDDVAINTLIDKLTK